MGRIMTQKEKLHEKIKNSPENVRFDDAVTWLLSWKFINRGGKGSHTVFTHPGYNGKLTFQSVNGMDRSYLDQTGIESNKGNLS